MDLFRLFGAPQNGPREFSKDALERNQPNRLLMDDSYQHLVGNGWKWWVAQTSSFKWLSQVPEV